MGHKSQNSLSALLSGALGVVGLFSCAFAAQQPDAGSSIQQVPLSPTPQAIQPEVHIQKGRAPSAPVSDETRIKVSGLHIAGSRVYTETELLEVAEFKPGNNLNLADLLGIAEKITEYYRNHGYFVAQAYLPAQEIKDGTVTVAVVEGQYGKISINNTTNLSTQLANGLLEGLNGGDVIATTPLESRLLLLSDLPGVMVKSTLVPGASVGSSDLIVDVVPGKRITGSVDADNRGNRYTGTNRIGGTININNPTGHGDVATVRLMTSSAGLSYVRPSYQVQIGKAKVGVAYSSMQYSLGGDFSSLQANGTATIDSIYGSYPLIRTRSSNLHAQLGFDSKAFQDKVDSTATVTEKKAQVWMASLNGDYRDSWGGGGMNNYSLTWTSGSIDIQSPAVLMVDLATARSNGRYGKLLYDFSRLQGVTETFSINAELNGQLATKNLDTSEKMPLGGGNAVRAYPEGEAYADEGYVLNIEARKALPTLAGRLPGRMQLTGFIDTGSATLNKNSWATGQNSKTLSGTGIGLNWVDDDFAVKAYVARKLGCVVATSAPDSMTRFGIQGIKYF